MSGPLGSQQWMYATEALPFYPYTIDNSLRFDGTSYLRRLSATSSTLVQFTMSFWVKISDTGATSTAYHLMSFQNYSDSATAGLCLWNESITYFRNGSASSAFNPGVNRDPSGWYHVVWKNKSDYYADIYINGVLIGTTTFQFQTLNGSALSVGSGTSGNNPFSGGYMTDVHFVSGLSLGPDSFGEYDSTGAIWMPKNYTGSHGTDGFHLKFLNSASLGADSSGNGNDLTATGLAASDQMLDSPTNNCCTLNPLDPGTTGTLSEGNLVTSGNAKVTMRPTTGQWYYEKDGVGVSYDAGTSGEFNPTLTAGSYNFGQRPWADVGPTGNQKAISAQNLPAPAFDPEQGASPQDAFNVYTDTGANILATAQSDFTDGLFWIKDRQNAADHQLLNTVTDTVLESNTTDAERAYSAPSGASVAWSWKAGGDSNIFNVDGIGYATASAAGLDGGTQNPTGATVNTEAGIGIYKYAGNNAVSTIAHGLGVLPKIVLLKNLTLGGNGWLVYTNAIDGSMDYGSLESTVAFATSARALTSTTFDHGPAASQGASGSNYLACVFAEREGFSKFGSYVGNGNDDGPFVYLGFRPAFIMVKCTSSSMNWVIEDAARSPSNVVDDTLYPNLSNAQDSLVASSVDFLSNGFKIRNAAAGWINSPTRTFLYMAFAEQPFKYANAR